MALIASVENGKVVDTRKEEETKASGNDLGYDQFLQLLCAEMQYQDPLEPTSNTEYVAQLATFSQMEAMLNMQNSIESSKANDLVGKYVMVKSTSPTTGETTATAGFVDYVQYENNKTYVYVNGNAYSIDDIYQVVDPEYMEAITLANAFRAAVANLPSADKLTVKDKEAVEALTKYLESMNSYQQSYIDQDTIKKYKELVAKMNELTGNNSDGSNNGGTGGSGGTGGTDGSGSTGGTGGSGSTGGTGGSGGTGGTGGTGGSTGA